MVDSGLGIATGAGSLILAILLSPSGLIVSFVAKAMSLLMIRLCDEKCVHDHIPDYDDVDQLFW